MLVYANFVSVSACHTLNIDRHTINDVFTVVVVLNNKKLTFRIFSPVIDKKIRKCSTCLCEEDEGKKEEKHKLKPPSSTHHPLSIRHTIYLMLLPLYF